ncbi:NADP oxidoreductase [Paenibacillus psychroresistens]|uniref:NADP oxidoreductase n=1 Tax=Paenibacillus psychroresistens TaxID=1778678 RepID=A0A6B8RV41_9BACL|nr:NAD(P)-binding domain-containing protein [Paenibacillus psychroresistens]QGQ99732.1 NADP oxidoreductase [Paenibacillus psychroresistens]
MKIGIIGTGEIGGNLTRLLTKLGHDVHIANSRGPHTLIDLVNETGAKAADISDVARGAEVVIISIPLKNIPDLPVGFLNEAASNAAIIETCNYYPKQRDGLIAPIEAGMPESKWVEQQLGKSVFKVFNGIWSKHLLERGLPKGSSGRIGLPVAGDDPHAKEIILQLVESLGFDAVDAGGLAESWRQQPGTPSYGKELNGDGIRQALSEASPIRTKEFTA